MAWRIITEGYIGAQGITEVSQVQNHAFGTIVRALSEDYGVGEFMYVKGVSGGGDGLMVYIEGSDGTTALTSTSGTAAGGNPIGVMVSALDAATDFGWVQISGDAVIKKTAVKYDPAGAQSVFLSATAGRIMQTSVASRRVMGARFTSATTVTATTSTAVVHLQRPHQQSAP